MSEHLNEVESFNSEARALLIRGIKYNTLDKQDLARDCFLKAIEDDPTMREAYYELYKLYTLDDIFDNYDQIYNEIISPLKRINVTNKEVLEAISTYEGYYMRIQEIHNYNKKQADFLKKEDLFKYDCRVRQEAFSAGSIIKKIIKILLRLIIPIIGLSMFALGLLDMLEIINLKGIISDCDSVTVMTVGYLMAPGSFILSWKLFPRIRRADRDEIVSVKELQETDSELKKKKAALMTELSELKKTNPFCSRAQQ